MSTKIFYNPVDEGFYHEGVQKVIPPSAVAISSSQYEEFMAVQQTGKKVCFEDGKFTFEDRLVSFEDLTHFEASWIITELEVAGEELDKVQDSDVNAVGTVAQWREYRKALRAWVNHKDFPNKNFRPKYPK